MIIKYYKLKKRGDMGKLQSKHACKRRENPEGGTCATSAPTLQRESAEHCEPHRIRHKQDVYGAELRDEQFLDHDCPLQVIIPPERAAEYQSQKLFLSSEHGDALKKTVKSDSMECNNMPVVDENRQEWVFTLYDFDNSGRVTKEDMSSLMHTICEVVDASVKQSALSKSKTLRVKLTVTPSVSSSKRDRDTGPSLNRRDHPEESHPSHVRGQSPDLPGGSEKKIYRMDENSERRNHYLDLAGIENYTSRFETDGVFLDEPQKPPTTLPSDCTPQSPLGDQGQDSLAPGARAAHPRRSQPDTCGPGKGDGSRSVCFLRSFRGRSTSAGAGGAGGKPSRLHGHHPVSWCHPDQRQRPQPQQHSHSKRLRARLRDAPSPPPAHPGVDRELQPGAGAPPAGLMPMTQKHEHHHLHEHHHHHHHHHHHYSS